MNQFRWREIVWRYVNLSHRTDRVKHISGQLERVGLLAQRFNALRKEDYDGPPEDVAQMQGTPNTIGQWLSMMALWRSIIGTDTLLGVLEDDALLAVDMCKRLQYIEDHFNLPFDIFFLGATFHADKAVWHPELDRDFEFTQIKHIVKVFGAFSNQGYITNPDSAEKILSMMQERMPYSRGSDHALIQIQPQLNCFCFVPGMVFQIDGQSDIGDGITRFSAFRESLGEYVWADRLEDFDYDTWAKGRK